MALTYHLEAYLTLERLMLDLDARDDPLADRMRDLMDPIWFALSAEEREYLDRRESVEVRIHDRTFSGEVGKTFPLKDVLAA
jgi:hypothetical protein